MPQSKRDHNTLFVCFLLLYLLHSMKTKILQLLQQNPFRQRRGERSRPENIWFLFVEEEGNIFLYIYILIYPLREIVLQLLPSTPKHTLHDEKNGGPHVCELCFHTVYRLEGETRENKDTHLAHVGGGSQSTGTRVATDVFTHRSSPSTFFASFASAQSAETRGSSSWM